MARCSFPTRTTARSIASATAMRRRPRGKWRRDGRACQNGGGRWPSGWRPFSSARPPASRRRAEALAEKIQLCSACHGEDGNSKIEKIPSLAGQPAFFILNQLFLMREGVRKVEAMAPIVKDLKDDDLTACRSISPGSPAKRSDEAGRSGAGQARRRDRRAAALRLLPSAEPGRAGADAAAGQAAHRLPDRRPEGISRQPRVRAAIPR